MEEVGSKAKTAIDTDRIVPCDNPRSPVDYCPRHSNCIPFSNGSDHDQDRFSYGCQCPVKGFTIEQTFEQSTDNDPRLRREICVDIDECAEGSHGCPENSQCRNTVGGHECDCTDGHKKTEDGTQCLPVCHEDPCKNDGKCEQSPVNPNEAVCNCKDGWRGDTCEVEDTETAHYRKSLVGVSVALSIIIVLVIIIAIIISKR